MSASSDEALRASLRAWQESGSDEDHARHLALRVRAGDLSPERLRLAAYVDHAAARLALGEDAPPHVDVQRTWAEGLAAWPGASLRAAAVAARLAAREYEVGSNPDPRPRRVLREVDAAVRGAADASRLWAAVDLAAQFAADEAGEAVLFVARAAAGALAHDRAPRAADEPSTPEGWAAAAIDAAGRTVGRELVREAIRDALSGWALSGVPC